MDRPAYHYVAIEGLIGSGKTTLTHLLVEEYGATPVLEAFDENPFLPLFYQKPEQYAFPLELSFLAERYHQLMHLQDQGNLFAQYLLADYHFGKCLLFARVNLPEAEYNLFRTFYQVMANTIRPPECILYLYMPPEKALAQIHKRGRSYESGITLDYLERIQRHYLDHFAQQQDLRVVLLDASDLDFVNRSEDLEHVKQVLGQVYPKGVTRVAKPLF